MCEFEDRRYEGALEIDFSLLVEVQGNLVFEAFYYYVTSFFFEGKKEWSELYLTCHKENCFFD